MEVRRLWKLLFFMDRLLFALPVRRHSAEGDDSPLHLDAIISDRLRLFWRGAWQQLWRMAEDSAEEKRKGRADLDDEAELRRIEKLMDSGEESRAASLVHGRAHLVSGPGVVKELRDLFPLLGRRPANTLGVDSVNLSSAEQW